MDTPREKSITEHGDPEKELESAGIPNEVLHSQGGVVASQILKHSHDADAAFKALESIDPTLIHIDEETNKRLLRKIDWHLIPIMCVVYGLNYLDKTTISYASIMGIKLPPSDNKLKSGINLTGGQYSWLGRYAKPCN
jgi:MFS transporter, ACS family, allantoate permease